MDLSGGSQAWLESSAGEKILIRHNLSMGRSSTNTLVLREEKVSRRHAIIHAQDIGEFWLADLGSSNGTVLNGRRLQLPMLLHDGDQIGIGNAVYVFRQNAVTELDTGPVTAERTIMEIQVLNCWMLVTDIEGFSALSQALPSDELAHMVGEWVSACKEIVEKHDGAINKYLGDGFFAYWHDSPDVPASIAAVLRDLQAIQAKPPAFRLVLHYGVVSVGGAASFGEESLLGKDVNFVFRMEKLGGSLKVHRLISEPAATRLASLLVTTPLPETHALPGFPDRYAFFTF